MPFRREPAAHTPDAERRWAELGDELVLLRELARSPPTSIQVRQPTADLRKKLVLAVKAARGTPLETSLTEMLAELPWYDDLINDLTDIDLLRTGAYPF